jgi:hypothetical protein
VFDEISLRFKEFSHHNTLLIDDCPYKCMGNVLFFYIMLHPFNSEVDDNKYILGTLWPWLVGLSNAPSTIAYVGSHHRGQKHVNNKICIGKP